MPGGDGTGPTGQGARTGKIRGECRREMIRRTNTIGGPAPHPGRRFRRGAGGSSNSGNPNRQKNKW